MRRRGLKLIPLAALTAIAASLGFAAPASAQTYTFMVPMSGDQEVPPVPTNATGSGTFVFDFDRNELCYEYSVRNLSSPFAAAHIHSGAAGVNGPIVIPLERPGSPLACVPPTGISEADLLADLYYVNVHTEIYPDGEIRGQLTNPSLGRPSNMFSFRKPRRRPNGTAVLPVVVPGPGVLALRGRGIRRRTRAVSSPGPVRLQVRAVRKAARQLRRTGRVRVVARVTYRPRGLRAARTQSRRIRLVRRG